MTATYPSDSQKSASETKDRSELPISVRLLHEQAEHMFPGPEHRDFRRALKATETPYQFYRQMSCRAEKP